MNIQVIKLTIYKKDGSIYWVEWFNDLASCNKWLTEEQTRFYWDSTYTWTVEDLTPIA